MTTLGPTAVSLNGYGRERTSLVSDDALRRHFNPSRETLWAKIAGLEQTLRMLRGASQDLVAQCWANLEAAKACIDHPWGHSNLAWRFVHRVDEDLLLAIPDVQLHSRAVDIRMAFDLNVTEPTTRCEWLGVSKEKGRLSEIVERLAKCEGEGVSHLPDRHLLVEALRAVNDQVDHGFWVLSMNVLTTVWSGVLLGALMLGLAGLWRWTSVSPLASMGTDPARDLALALVLGAMGAYVGNLLTRKDFMFVQGGPFVRYVLHPLLTKPIMGAFAAGVVYLVASSGIVLGNGSQPGGDQGFALVVPKGSLGYVHALLAIASGFASEKVLGDMIGAVLRRLERKAEKTAKPKEEPAA